MFKKIDRSKGKMNVVFSSKNPEFAIKARGENMDKMKIYELENIDISDTIIGFDIKTEGV